MKFTDRKVKNLKPMASKKTGELERYIEWEGSGLGVRVSAQGRKSWIFMYRYEKKSRMMTLGVYPSMSVAEAHKSHGKALFDVEKGQDPGARLVEKKREDRSAPTVENLKKEYLQKWAKTHKRTWREDDRMLEKDVIPKWGKRKAESIKRRDVIRLLDGIVERGAPIVANRVLEIVRKMFNFGIEQDAVAINPCAGVRAPGKETQRERVLSEDEIRSYWEGLDKADMAPATRVALKLLLVTAQRRGEVATAEKSEFDKDWWTIPGEKSKNGLSHRVPLSFLAVKLVREAIKLSGDSPYLFPSLQTSKSITPGSLTKAISNNREVLGADRFTPHDLRRTAASLMTGAGIDRLVVKKILNHADRDVTAVYDRHSYDQEKQRAMKTWGRKLGNILEGKKQSKIVKLA